MPDMPQPVKDLKGYLVGLSVGDSQDVQAYGLLPRHLDIAFGAIVTALVLNKARLAYGGDLRQRGFTQQLYENVAEAYAEDYLRGDSSSDPPFVHYLASHIWTPLPGDLAPWLASSGGLVEVRFMRGDGYIAVRALENTFLLQAEHEADERLPSVADLMGRLKQLAPEHIEANPETDAASLAQMRKQMGRDCDARILLGGKMYDYAGLEPGIPAEARDSIVEGAAVLPLGGYGGAARDVAIGMGLAPLNLREGTPRGRGYPETMTAIERCSALAMKRLAGKVDEARDLARTTDSREAARLVVEILRGLPKRPPRQ